MATRNFSSVAVQATLTEAVTSVGTSWKVTDVTGWPSPPFVVIADKDKAAEEAALVTAVSGTTITVTRGWDSTPALPHEAGATVTHGVTAVDFRDANLHVNATVGVHGVTGAVVGTTDTQVLDNKTFTSSSGTSAPLSVQQAPGQSGNLVELRTAAGQVAGYFDAAGKMVAPAISVTQRADFTPASSAAKAIVVTAKSGQAANLIEVVDPAGSPLFTVGPTGNCYAPNLTQDVLNATTVVAQSVQTVNLTATGTSALGTASATSLSASGGVSGATVTASGAATSGSVSTGDVTATTVTASGAVSGATVTSTGALTHRGGVNVPRMAAGVASLSMSGASFDNVTVTFPVGRFTVPPIVTASFQNAVSGSGRLSCKVSSISTSGCVISVNVGDGTTTSATGMQIGWVAVQMGDTAAG